MRSAKVQDVREPTAAERALARLEHAEARAKRSAAAEAKAVEAAAEAKAVEAAARAALEKHPYSKLLKRLAEAEKALGSREREAREASDWAELDRKELGSAADRRRIRSAAKRQAPSR